MFAQKLKTILPLTLVALGALTCATLAASHEPPTLPSAPVPKAAPRPVDPAPPKATAKPLPKGPNKLALIRDGQLVLMDPDGKNEKTLGGGPEKRTPMNLRVSPDGSMIAVLYAGPIPPDDGVPGAKRAPTSLFVRKVDEKGAGTDLGVPADIFTWSPDGREIAYSEIAFVEGKLKEVIHGSIDVATKAKTPLKLPSDHLITDWSRDGRYFLTTAFNLKGDGTTTQMFLVNRDGTERKALGDKATNPVLGRLSPDGTRVLYSTATRKAETPAERKARQDLGGREPEPERALVVLDIATEKVTTVKDVPLNAELQDYCWSPDGKKIAYSWRQRHEGQSEDAVHKETETHLIVCDPDGKNAKTIASVKGNGPSHLTIRGTDWR